MTNTLKKNIDKVEALALLAKAVAERGTEYRDGVGSHYYFDPNGLPSCGVGLALSYVGVTREHVGARNNASVPNLVRVNEQRLPIALDSGAIRVLEAFRVKQDDNKPWAEAFDAALKVL